MTPPEAIATGSTPRLAETPPAVSVCLQVMRKRTDFLLAARAQRKAMPAFLLQARKRNPEETNPSQIRIGYTCSKKVGNAVTRNRAKRRLREIARAVLPELGQGGWDYVLVGRPVATIEQPYESMLADLAKALRVVHSGQHK